LKKNNKKKQINFLSLGIVFLTAFLMFNFLMPSEKGPSYTYDEILGMFANGTVKKYTIDFNSAMLSMGVPRTEKELAEYDEKNKKPFEEEKPNKNLTEEELNAFKEEQVRRKEAFADKRDYKLRQYKLPDISLFLKDIGKVIEKYNVDHPQDIIRYNYIPPVEQPWWFSMMPYALLLLSSGLLVFFMMRQSDGAGKAMSFGKLRAKQIIDENNKVTFDDVAGADEEKEELSELVEFLKDPLKFEALGAKIPKGVLLVGPPGTGKTLLAKAVAGEAKVSYFSLSGSDFVEMFVGVGAKRVRALFNEAKSEAPSIVFIDEIDAVGRQRGAGLGGGNDEREQTLNQLLVEMDGFAPNQGVIVIAATNRRDVLDPALLRAGRFDRQVFVNRPDIKGREDILKVHTRNKPLAPDVNLRTVAKGTVGFTGADLANVINEAALLAARGNKKAITQKNIEGAIIKVIAGPEKRTKVVTENDKKLTAYHEAGHAITTYCCNKVDRVHEISIIPRGMAGGYTLSLPDKEESYKLKEQLFQELIVLLGGRAAENIVLDDISTGASNDIQRVTDIARAMVTQYGFSNNIGPIVYGSDNNQVFLGRDYGTAKEFSDITANKIDEEVRLIVFEAYAKAKSILKQNIDKLHLVAKVLIDFEKIDGGVFERLMTNDKEIVKQLEQKREEEIKEEQERKRRIEEEKTLSLAENVNLEADTDTVKEEKEIEDDTVESTDDMEDTIFVDEDNIIKDVVNDEELTNDTTPNIKTESDVLETEGNSDIVSDIPEINNEDIELLYETKEDVEETFEIINNRGLQTEPAKILTKQQKMEKELNSIIDLESNGENKVTLDKDSKEYIKKTIADNIKNKYLNKMVKKVDDKNVQGNDDLNLAQKTKIKEKEENKLSNSLIDIIENNTNSDNKK